MCAFKAAMRTCVRNVCGESFEKRLWYVHKKLRLRLRLGLPRKDREAFECIKSFVSPGATVIDIGANIGLWTYCLRKAVGDTGRVVAFEPVPETFEVLRKLCGRCGNVRMLNVGLSDQDCLIEFALPCEGIPYTTAAVKSTASQLHDRQRITEKAKLPLKKLDSLSEQLDLNNIQFIKCDVEGHELEVLRGGQFTIQQHKPVILIEILREKWQGGNPYSSASAQFLATQSYQGWQIHNGRFLKHGEFVESSEEFCFLPNDHH